MCFSFSCKRQSSTKGLFHALEQDPLFTEHPNLPPFSLNGGRPFSGLFRRQTYLRSITESYTGERMDDPPPSAPLTPRAALALCVLLCIWYRPIATRELEREEGCRRIACELRTRVKYKYRCFSAWLSSAMIPPLARSLVARCNVLMPT